MGSTEASLLWSSSNFVRFTMGCAASTTGTGVQQLTLNLSRQKQKVPLKRAQHWLNIGFVQMLRLPTKVRLEKTTVLDISHNLITTLPEELGELCCVVLL